MKIAYKNYTIIKKSRGIPDTAYRLLPRRPSYLQFLMKKAPLHKRQVMSDAKNLYAFCSGRVRLILCTLLPKHIVLPL